MLIQKHQVKINSKKKSKSKGKKRPLDHNNPLYYTVERPIGFAVLLNSLNEAGIPFDNNIEAPGLDMRFHLYIPNDWHFVFMAAERLKNSLESGERFNIAFDGTVFYLFLRIYYDSLASLIHHVFRIIYPKNSKKWPPARSFNKQLKWVEKHKQDDPFKEYDYYLKGFSFDSYFSKIRDLRNSLKEVPHDGKSERLAWKMYGLNIKSEVKKVLHKTIEFSDFIGDYLLSKMNIMRMESDHHGYPRSFMEKSEIKIYKWFVCSLQSVKW